MQKKHQLIQLKLPARKEQRDKATHAHSQDEQKRMMQSITPWTDNNKCMSKFRTKANTIFTLNSPDTDLDNISPEWSKEVGMEMNTTMNAFCFTEVPRRAHMSR